MQAPLTIQLLGSFHVTVEGEPLPRLRSRKGEWLLALLVLRTDRPVRREWLAENLWPDSLPEDALTSLRQSLKDLRTALGSQAWRLRAVSGRALQLDLSGAEVDLRRFDEAVRRGDRHSLELAVSLYAGPLLEGCSEPWVLAERSARENAYLSALEHLARGARTRGEPRKACEYLRAATVTAPHSGSLLRELLQALSDAGELQAVVEAYHEHRRWLYREHGARPDEETVTLFHLLRLAKPVTATPLTTGNIPKPFTSLVGREAVLRELEGKLLTSRLVTLTGPGGVGKTRLALTVAYEGSADYADLAWLVELSALRDPVQLPAAIARGLFLEPAPASVPELVRALAGRQLLLVLDNCEHLLAACAHAVSAILGNCPDVRILATSRERLGITGEVVLPVAPLALPEGGAIDLGDYPATRLFRDRAGLSTVSAEEADAIAQLCRRLDGLPLAIELAAALTDTLSVGEIAARLSQLRSDDPTLPERHRTLAAVVDWSYQRLDLRERLLFRRLALFAGTWSLALAEAVCADEAELPAAEVLPVLVRLVRKSLVAPEDARFAERCYRMLETIRAYAEHRLPVRERELLQRRRLLWLVTRAEDAEHRLTGPEQREALARLDAEYGNLRAALEWGLASREPDALHAGQRLAAALGRYWQIRGLFAEGRSVLQQALERGALERGAPDGALRARLVGWAGYLACFQGEYVAARELAREALRLYEALGDARGGAEALGTLAIVAKDQGELEAARTLFLESRGGFERVGDRPGVATVDGYLGILAAAAGEDADAERLYLQALAERRALGDTWGIAASLNNLGLLALRRGHLSAAEPFLAESLTLRRELGDRRCQAVTLNNLGKIALRQGHPDRAAQLFAESLELAVAIGDRRSLAYSLEAIARLQIEHGDPAEGVRLFASAAALREELSAPLAAREREEQDHLQEQATSALGREAADRCAHEGRLRELTRTLAAARTSLRRYSASSSAGDLDVLGTVR